jgi:hypothetical protein
VGNEDERVEYSATNDVYMHYDGFRWQAGSFLVTGVFVFWGLLIQQQLPRAVIVVASFLVTVLMAIWLLFAHHYRQIYLAKLHRLRELERQIGAEQHRRFSRLDAVGALIYPSVGPRGHHLDIAVFVVTSVGSVALGAARDGFAWVLLSSLPLVTAVAGLVLWNERRYIARLQTVVEMYNVNRTPAEGAHR